MLARDGRSAGHAAACRQPARPARQRVRTTVHSTLAQGDVPQRFPTNTLQRLCPKRPPKKANSAPKLNRQVPAQKNASRRPSPTPESQICRSGFAARPSSDCRRSSTSARAHPPLARPDTRFALDRTATRAMRWRATAPCAKEENVISMWPAGRARRTVREGHALGRLVPQPACRVLSCAQDVFLQGLAVEERVWDAGFTRQPRGGRRRNQRPPSTSSQPFSPVWPSVADSEGTDTSAGASSWWVAAPRSVSARTTQPPTHQL